jgi:hypothetical protein
LHRTEAETEERAQILNTAFERLAALEAHDDGEQVG